MYAPAGFDETDAVQNVPIVITTDGADMLPASKAGAGVGVGKSGGVAGVQFPPSSHVQKIQQSAPVAPKPSSLKGGGRRGKNISSMQRGSGSMYT
jgi:hypothetical protein